MHVILAVSDVATSVEFYERVFGWPRNDWIDSDRAWGERPAWFADPDGNVVAVAQATSA